MATGQRIRIGEKKKPLVTAPFGARDRGGSSQAGYWNRRWAPQVEAARVVLARAYAEGVNQDKMKLVDRIRSVPYPNAVRFQFGMPGAPDNDPPKALLEWLYRNDLNYWIGGFTEVLNGVLVGRTRRGAFRQADTVGDWIHRYTYQQQLGRQRHVHLEYLVVWHIVENEPKKDIDYKLTGSGGLSWRVPALRRDIQAKKSALRGDWWLKLGADIGEFAAQEAISYLTGAALAKKLQQAYKASAWVAKWLSKLGRTGDFVVRHSKKITDVTSAIIVAAIKSRGGAGDMAAAGLSAPLGGPASVFIEGLGLAAGLIDLGVKQATKRIDQEIQRDPRSKSKKPEDMVAIDVAQMEAELRILLAREEAFKGLLKRAETELARQIAGSRNY